MFPLNPLHEEALTTGNVDSFSNYTPVSIKSTSRGSVNYEIDKSLREEDILFPLNPLHEEALTPKVQKELEAELQFPLNPLHEEALTDIQKKKSGEIPGVFPLNPLHEEALTLKPFHASLMK